MWASQAAVQSTLPVAEMLANCVALGRYSWSIRSGSFLLLGLGAVGLFPHFQSLRLYEIGILCARTRGMHASELLLLTEISGGSEGVFTHPSK